MEETEKVKEGAFKEIGERIANKLPSSVHIIMEEGPSPLPQHEETPVKLSGVLDSSLKWLEKRIHLINQESSFVLVNRDIMSIELTVDERNHYKDKITGKLELHPAFLKFGINSGNYLTNFQMSDLIKMNRSFFESKSAAMTLVTLLKNFKAKIDSEIEKANDNHGNYKVLREQAVTHNLPESFKMVLPIFKGQKPVTMEVELYIEPDEFRCALISPEANEEIESIKNSAIDKVLVDICSIAPDLPIIEQ